MIWFAPPCTACKYSRLACRHILLARREPPTHRRTHTLEVEAVVFSSLYYAHAGLLAGSSSEVSDGCQASSGPWLGISTASDRVSADARCATTQCLAEPHCLTRCCAMFHGFGASPCAFLVRRVPNWSTSERWDYIDILTFVSTTPWTSELGNFAWPCHEA